MTSKQTLIRYLFFFVFAATLGFFCTGCTAIVLKGQFGAKESRFDLPKYAMSPDRREIIVTSARETRRFLQPPSIWNSTWKERIPVEPAPDCLMRCFLFVEPDPDAPRYWHDAPFVINTDVLPLNEDRTLYLRVHPDELDDLSQPFKVKLIPSDAEKSGPVTDPSELRMMFPVAVNGNMYVLLTAAPGEPRTNLFRQKAKELVRQETKGRGEFSYFTMVKMFPSLIGSQQSRASLTRAAYEWDEREADRYLYPFCEGMDEVRMIEYERRFGERFPTWDAVLWKALWLPPAVVVDTVLMPAYFVGSVGLYAILHPLSGIQ
ncbi:MAG: hypothetical protein J6Y92_07230 [Lentisphaeria bacterium]|nr:hypothetical protein [Lentisphaeria bacterium]